MVDEPERAPRGTRAIGVLALLLGAPVSAGRGRSYLPSTGALAGTLFVVSLRTAGAEPGWRLERVFEAC